jgi:hypothetical protein
MSGHFVKPEVIDAKEMAAAIRIIIFRFISVSDKNPNSFTS